MRAYTGPAPELWASLSHEYAMTAAGNSLQDGDRMMTKAIALGVVALGVLAGSMCWAQAALPAELTHLQELVGDAGELVAAARRFDLQQQKLLKWYGELARDYAEEGKPDFAAIKAEESKRRLALVEQSWLFTLQYYPNDARANNYFGEFLYDYQGRHLDAVQKWLLAARLDDELASPQSNLGIHYFHNGDYEPDNPDFLYNLSQMYVIHFPYLQQKCGMSEKKLYSEAMRFSREAAKYAPDDYDIVKDYAMNFLAGANFGVEVKWDESAEAWFQVRKLARNEDERFFCQLQVGRSWIKARKWALALAALNEARTLGPDSVVVQNLIDETEEKLRQ